MRRLTLALLTSCLLCACGQKGALYIPGEERETVTTSSTIEGSPAPATPAATPAASATDEERERAAAARNNRPN